MANPLTVSGGFKRRGPHLLRGRRRTDSVAMVKQFFAPFDFVGIALT